MSVNELGAPGTRKSLLVNVLQLSSLNRKKKLVFNPKSVIIVVMKETIEVLMSRDGLSQAEAVKRVVGFFKTMKADIQEFEGSPSDWENQFVEEFGLEPDYFEDFIFRVA